MVTRVISLAMLLALLGTVFGQGRWEYARTQLWYDSDFNYGLNLVLPGVDIIFTGVTGRDISDVVDEAAGYLGAPANLRPAIDYITIANLLGMDGWEMVAYTQYHHSHVYVFKRPLR